MVFVRVVDGQQPLILVVAPVIWGIAASPDLLEAVNDLNTRIGFERVLWTGHEVMAGTDLPGSRVFADGIGFACR